VLGQEVQAELLLDWQLKQVELQDWQMVEFMMAIPVGQDATQVEPRRRLVDVQLRQVAASRQFWQGDWHCEQTVMLGK
jgi:hypothetical protein